MSIKRHQKKVLSTLLIFSFLIGMPLTSSHAQSTAPQNTKAATSATQNFKGRNHQAFNIKPLLDKLVASKTLTAAQESKIIAFENQKNAARIEEMKKRHAKDGNSKESFTKPAQSKPTTFAGRFDALVKDKTLTQKQADAIEKAIKDAHSAAKNLQH